MRKASKSKKSQLKGQLDIRLHISKRDFWLKVAKLYFQNKEEMKQNTPGLSIESTMKKKKFILRQV